MRTQETSATDLVSAGSRAVQQAFTAIVQRCATKGMLPAHLNNGLCHFVASEAEFVLSGRVPVIRQEVTGMEYYLLGSNAEAYHGWFTARYPGWSMPYGLSLQELCNTRYFDVMHVWLTCNGLHYDAQCPEGVRNFLDLPIFRLNMVAALAEYYPEKWPHLMQHPWWQQSLMWSDEAIRDITRNRFLIGEL